ncbi:MAG: hypothetical protein SGARI_000500 [Bacillariaceae sp.]
MAKHFNNSPKSVLAAKANAHSAKALPSSKKTFELKPKEMAILKAIGKLHAAQIGKKSKKMVAALAGQSKTPEGFKKMLGGLKKKGFIIYGANDTVDLTDLGIEAVGYSPALTNTDFHEQVIKVLLTPKGWTIFQHIIDREVHNKINVAKEMGYPMSKLSGYDKDLSKMTTLGFLKKTTDTIQLTEKCFPCDE